VKSNPIHKRGAGEEHVLEEEGGKKTSEKNLFEKRKKRSPPKILRLAEEVGLWTPVISPGTKNSTNRRYSEERQKKKRKKADCTTNSKRGSPQPRTTVLHPPTPSRG